MSTPDGDKGDAPEQGEAREQGRRGKNGATRQRLIDLSIDLIRREGITSVTAARITKEAGITQPGFYAHFKNVEDCVGVAVLQLVESVNSRQAAVRRAALDRYHSFEDFTNFELQRVTYSESIELLLDEPQFTELFIRHRGDGTFLGGIMRGFADRARATMIADLWEASVRVGYRPEHYAAIAFFAEELLAMTFAACEALIAGRFTDRELIYDSLAYHTCVMMKHSTPDFLDHAAKVRRERITNSQKR